MFLFSLYGVLLHYKSSNLTCQFASTKVNSEIHMKQTWITACLYTSGRQATLKNVYLSRVVIFACLSLFFGSKNQHLGQQMACMHPYFLGKWKLKLTCPTEKIYLSWRTRQDLFSSPELLLSDHILSDLKLYNRSY